jgi:hypothetical protein
MRFLRTNTAWFLVGVLAAVFLLYTQAKAIGGWSGLLAVGEESTLRPLIEAEFPGLRLVPGEGNDGQIYYAIGLDLAGDQAPPYINDPELRYQRIVYPAVAALGGMVGGEGLFWSMVVVSILAMGMTTAASETIRRHLGLNRWIHAGVLLNPGIWLAARQLTPDLLGLGLGLAGISLALRRKWGFAVALLAVSALTKESLVLLAGGLALWLLAERRILLMLAVGAIPSLTVVLWSFQARALAGGSGALGGGNWSLPLLGLVDASSFWPQTPLRERVMTAISLLTILVGVLAFAATKSIVARCLLLPWLILPMVTSEWVWRFGNGSLRGFAVIGVLAGIALAGAEEAGAQIKPQMDPRSPVRAVRYARPRP